MRQRMRVSLLILLGVSLLMYAGVGAMMSGGAQPPLPTWEMSGSCGTAVPTIPGTTSITQKCCDEQPFSSFSRWTGKCVLPSNYAADFAACCAGSGKSATVQPLNPHVAAASAPQPAAAASAFFAMPAHSSRATVDVQLGNKVIAHASENTPVIVHHDGNWASTIVHEGKLYTAHSLPGPIMGPIRPAKPQAPHDPVALALFEANPTNTNTEAPLTGSPGHSYNESDAIADYQEGWGQTLSACLNLGRFTSGNMTFNFTTSGLTQKDVNNTMNSVIGSLTENERTSYTHSAGPSGWFHPGSFLNWLGIGGGPSAAFTLSQGTANGKQVNDRWNNLTNITSTAWKEKQEKVLNIVGWIAGWNPGPYALPSHSCAFIRVAKVNFTDGSSTTAYLSDAGVVAGNPATGQQMPAPPGMDGQNSHLDISEGLGGIKIG